MTGYTDSSIPQPGVYSIGVHSVFGSVTNWIRADVEVRTTIESCCVDGLGVTKPAL